MRVAIVLSGRSAQPMGLETAEQRLVSALRAGRNGCELAVHVVGGRAARRTAASLGGRWIPGRHDPAPRRAFRGADVVHLLGLTLPPPAGRFVATFHDLSPLHYDDEGALSPYAEEIAARARLCLCPSAFTASELERLLGVEPARLRVVPNGPGQALSPATPPLSDGELAALGLARPLVLRTGGYTARKNVRLLLDAWPEVRRATGATLALVGPAHAARVPLLAAAPSTDGVRVLDYLGAETLARLIRTADVLVSPSLYEGFGLPPLEAMAAGTPVVAVRTPFAEEVCGDAALLVENDAGALATAIVRALTDPGLGARGPARAAAFGWDRAARLLFAAYADALRP